MFHTISFLVSAWYPWHGGLKFVWIYNGRFYDFAFSGEVSGTLPAHHPPLPSICIYAHPPLDHWSNIKIVSMCITRT